MICQVKPSDFLVRIWFIPEEILSSKFIYQLQELTNLRQVLGQRNYRLYGICFRFQLKPICTKFSSKEKRIYRISTISPYRYYYFQSELAEGLFEGEYYFFQCPTPRRYYLSTVFTSRSSVSIFLFEPNNFELESNIE